MKARKMTPWLTPYATFSGELSFQTNLFAITLLHIKVVFFFFPIGKVTLGGRKILLKE
jgi:hypothetical protein